MTFWIAILSIHIGKELKLIKYSEKDEFEKRSNNSSIQKSK